MIIGLLVLVAFQVAGELLALWLDLPIPGAVLGLLLLLLSLRLLPWHKTLLEPTDQVSGTLINHLSLLFLPAGVGIFFLPDYINAQWPAVFAAMLGGTFVAMVVSSLVYRVFAARAKTRE